jgi:hypothetical protein
MDGTRLLQVMWKLFLTVYHDTPTTNYKRQYAGQIILPVHDSKFTKRR